MKVKSKSKRFRAVCLALSVLMVIPPAGWAQVVAPASVSTGEPEQLLELRWSDAPLQVVLDHYAELTGRTLIKSPGIPAVLISLKSQEKLTESEFLVAIESVLRMNNIGLVPMGEKFLKVVPIAELGTHGELIEMGRPTPGGTRDADVIERRIVELKNVELPEIQPVIDQLKHATAKIQPLERANSFLITDTKVNLDRIIEIIEFLDKPIDIKVETRIYELQHAEAGEVSSRLSELIQESQSTSRSTSSRTATPATRGGVIRAGTTAAQAAAAAAQARSAGQSAMDLAQRGIIQGEVKLVSDERTNILIIISEPANFSFFDQIVTVLDKAIDPEVAVEVLPLEFADAEEISGILNDFVGAATQDSSRSGTRSSSTQSSSGDSAADARSTALRDFIARRQASSTTTAPATAVAAAGIGQLSEDTRILADARTNSILLMGRRSDIEALRRVVDDLDVMLSQVMIEAIIIEVSLSEGVESGFDWLQRSYQAFNEEKLGPGGGFSVRQPVLGFGGAQQFSGNTFIDGGAVDRETGFSTGALTYFATLYDLNVDVILQLAASSSDARILSTPVVVTTDNTEARIIVGESRPVVTSTSVTVGGVGRNTFQYQDIGIELTVTPRINPQKFVVMEINQTADNVGGFEVIDGNNVPVITRRELEAQIAVENRSSIVLGGLMGAEARKSRTKIPLLGDIPILGALFRSDVTDENRQELLVVITPYVMSTPEETLAESKRLADRSVVSGERAWSKTWSDSPLIREHAMAEERAPQPLLDRFRNRSDDAQALSPEALMAVPVAPETRVIMRPAPTVEYRVVPDPQPDRRPVIESSPPRMDQEPAPTPPLSRVGPGGTPVAEEVVPPQVDAAAVSALRSRIQDPRAAMEVPAPGVESVEAGLFEPVPMGESAPAVVEAGETVVVDAPASDALPETEAAPAPKKRGLFSRLLGRTPQEPVAIAEPPPMNDVEMSPAVVAVVETAEPVATEEVTGDTVVASEEAPPPPVESAAESALVEAPPAVAVPETSRPAEAEINRMESPRRPIDALRLRTPSPPEPVPAGATPRETVDEAPPVRPVPAPGPVAEPTPVAAPVVGAQPASDRSRRLAQELQAVTGPGNLPTQEDGAEEAVEPVAEEDVVSPMPAAPRRVPEVIPGPQPMGAAPPVSGSANEDDVEAAPPLK